MLDIKKVILRKRISFLRTALIIAGFAGIIHFAHRECNKITDKPFYYNDISKSSIASGGQEEFQATAYCVTGITRSGAAAAPGRVASDPKVIPLGSIIYVDSPLMGGIYQALDTGELIKGKIIDIFIPNYDMCREFGRRMVKVKILRYGFLGYPPSKAEEDSGR